MSRAAPLASRGRTRRVLVALLLIGLLAAWDGWQWARLAALNREVDAIVQAVPTQATAGAQNPVAGAGAGSAAGAATAPSAPAAFASAARAASNAGVADADATATAAQAPPEIRFAQAWALAESGRADAALNRYRALQADTPLGQAARFNAANLLLRQAIELRAGEQPGQSIALIELAKETLRDVLRVEPDHWGARYNLERAQRLLPDPEPGEDMAGAAPEQRERAATTMRGFSPGLP